MKKCGSAETEETSVRKVEIQTEKLKNLFLFFSFWIVYLENKG